MTEQIVIQTEQTQLVLENPGVTLNIEEISLELRIGADQGPMGPSGPPGVVEDYTHVQSSLSTVWTINHNLGRKPDVTLLSVGDQEFEGVVTHTSTNQAVVSLSSAAAGTARCI